MRPCLREDKPTSHHQALGQLGPTGSRQPLQRAREKGREALPMDSKATGVTGRWLRGGREGSEGRGQRVSIDIIDHSTN